MSWSQMEDEAFDLEAGYSLDRPEERPSEVNQAEDNNKAQENLNTNEEQVSRPLNRNFELERIDQLLAQNKTKQTFKITIVQQPLIKNHKHIIVALSLLGSPAISFNPLDYIVLSTNLIKVDTDEEVDELTGQTAIIIHGNNESMPLDLTIESTTLRGEYRLTFNLYRIIIIGDTNVKLLCGTLHSKPFQVDTSHVKLQPSTFTSLDKFSPTPKQVLQKLASLHQILEPLKENSVDDLKRKKTHAHLWYGGLIWPTILSGDSDQHYVELFINTRHSFDLADLPPLLEPKTVTLDDSLLNDRHSFECQIYSPRVTGTELINAFRDKTTQKYWCFVIEFAACKLWIQPRFIAAGTVRLTCRMKINEGYGSITYRKEHLNMTLADIRRSLASKQVLESPRVNSDSGEDTEKGLGIEEVSSGSDDERPKKRAKVMAVDGESRKTTDKSRRLSWCDPSAPCPHCHDYITNKHAKKQACLLRPSKK